MQGRETWTSKLLEINSLRVTDDKWIRRMPMVTLNDVKENHTSMDEIWEQINNIESFQQVFYKRGMLWFPKLAKKTACDDLTEIPRIFLKAWCD